MTMDIEPSTYDLVTMVATLHHMDRQTGLARARDLLRPKGKLVVIGVSANKTPTDYAFFALVLPVVDFSVESTERREMSRWWRWLLVKTSEKFARLLILSCLALWLGEVYYRYILTWNKAS